MLDEETFRKQAEGALEQLKKELFATEDDGGFEVEEQNGVLSVSFDEPAGKFVITPNTPVRQIWISALSTSYKLDWSDSDDSFVLPATRETLNVLLPRLIEEQLAG